VTEYKCLRVHAPRVVWRELRDVPVLVQQRRRVDVQHGLGSLPVQLRFKQPSEPFEIEPEEDRSV
jgi:hypothetical protein